MHFHRNPLLFILCLGLTSPACGSHDRSHEQATEPAVERVQDCAYCGMRVDPEASMTVRVVLPAQTLRFDSPKCFFGYQQEHSDVALGAAEVREYYSGDYKRLGEVRWVLESDVMGAMGKDLIPVAPEHTDRFTRDHHGHVHTGTIDRALLEPLFSH